MSQIPKAKWYIYDREHLVEYSGYGENADRMRAIGKVFPVLFFLMAILLSKRMELYIRMFRILKFRTICIMQELHQLQPYFVYFLQQLHPVIKSCENRQHN
ncbi:Uncharacterised protein [Dorea longicatena]|nr:Uncharacterised protein [Dorea longicatena]